MEICQSLVSVFQADRGKRSLDSFTKITCLLQCEEGMILRASAHRNTARRCSLRQDMYIGDSCGVGCQDQVLRIATILYSVGDSTLLLLFVCLFVLIHSYRGSRKKVGVEGSPVDWAAETWEDYVNECVSACKGAPFPNLLNQDSFWDASLLDPRKASHQETSFGII